MLRRLQETSSTTDGDEPEARVMRAFFLCSSFRRCADGVAGGTAFAPEQGFSTRTRTAGAPRGPSRGSPGLWAPMRPFPPLERLHGPFRRSFLRPWHWLSRDVPAGSLLEEACAVMIHTYVRSLKGGAYTPSKKDFRGRSGAPTTRSGGVEMPPDGLFVDICQAFVCFRKYFSGGFQCRRGVLIESESQLDRLLRKKTYK